MAAAIRLQFLDGDSLSHPVLWICGCIQFMDLCMEWGLPRGRVRRRRRTEAFLPSVNGEIPALRTSEEPDHLAQCDAQITAGVGRC